MKMKKLQKFEALLWIENRISFGLTLQEYSDRPFLKTKVTPIMSTRSTYGYSKVTIQCTGSPSMRKVWDCDDIPGNTSCCRKVAKDKNANFLWVFWQIMGDMMMPTKLRDLSQQY